MAFNSIICLPQCSSPAPSIIIGEGNANIPNSGCYSFLVCSVLIHGEKIQRNLDNPAQVRIRPAEDIQHILNISKRKIIELKIKIGGVQIVLGFSMR